jgi:hypothetical protein
MGIITRKKLFVYAWKKKTSDWKNTIFSEIKANIFKINISSYLNGVHIFITKIQVITEKIIENKFKNMPVNIREVKN